MEQDPLARVNNKIQEVVRKTQILEKQIKSDEQDIDHLTKQIESLQEKLGETKNFHDDAQIKVESLDKLIEECEKSIRKIVETAVIFEKIIEEEIGVA